MMIVILSITCSNRKNTLSFIYTKSFDKLSNRSAATDPNYIYVSKLLVKFELNITQGFSMSC